MLLRPLAALVPSLVVAAVTTAQVDPSLLAGMKARAIGPATMSGRVVAIDAVHKDPNTIYVGAASGGLWKSTSGGTTFTPIFDDQPVASIGAIEIFQPSPDIVWVGTGEGNPRNSVSLGNGVYKTTDGGRHWTHLGLENTERIRRIWVHPEDPDHALVAALGTAWGENPDRGLFQTKDGGKSWQRILYVDQKTGCIDIEVDPTNPRKMFASMWDYRRKPWTFRSGGEGSGLYRSVDGGKNWTRLGVADGMPRGILGRIKAAFAPSNPKTVYALVEAKKSVLLKSTDGGFSFRVVNSDSGVAPRPFYYCDLRIDPADENRIYNLHSTVTLSTDGGKSFRGMVGYAQAHPDHHDMWIDPNNPQHLILGNDGGIAFSKDHGKNWQFAFNLPLGQYYHIAVDMDVPYNIYGGMQDNGSWRGPSTVWENGGIRNHHWQEVCFGDGFATLPYPKDSLQGYAMSQGGNLIRYNIRTAERKTIKPRHPDDEVELRFNWNAGIAQCPFDAETIYYGSQFVHKSTDRGDSWTVISPDLTTNHKDWQKQGDSGGLTYDVTGAENYTTILTIAPSALDKNIVWAGTDDGRVHVTQDGGKTWSSVEANIPGLPRNTWCPHIEQSKFDKGTAYAVFDDHRRANLKPYLFVTRDFGKTWTNLVAGSSVRGYCLCVEQDPVDANLLFLGTEFGLWFSANGGREWSQFKHGVPTCSVMALVVHPRDHDLILGTHGRSAFVIDDISPLRGLSRSVLEAPLKLSPVPAAIAHGTMQTGGERFPGQGEFRGQTKPRGAMISFYANQRGLKHPDPKVEAARDTTTPQPASNGDAAPKQLNGSKKKASKPPRKGMARVEILDKDKVIHTFERPIKLGLNRVIWSLRRDSARRATRPAGGGGRRFRGGFGGPVLPGTYTVRVTVGTHSETSKVEVFPDPRRDIPMKDRIAKDKLRREAEAIGSRTAVVTERLAKIKPELAAVASKLARMDKKKKPKALDKAVKDAQAAIKKFEESLYGKPGSGQGIRRRSSGLTSKIMRAAFSISSTGDAPTKDEKAGVAKAKAMAERLIQDFNKVLAGPIARYNKALSKTKLSFSADTRRVK